MTQAHRRRVEAALAAARAGAEQAERRLADLVADLHDNPPDDEHDPDGATLGLERAMARAERDRHQEAVAQARAALDRLDAGTATTCVACGGPIAAGRLAARPTTDRCVRCA